MPALRSMMPAIKGFVGNEAHNARSASGYEWPPCIIIERGESLQEWAQREQHDFVTILQVGANTHACMHCAALGGSNTLAHCICKAKLSPDVSTVCSIHG